MVANRTKNISGPEIVSTTLFIAFSFWWVFLYFLVSGQFTEQNLYWAASYQVVAWWAGLFGLYSSFPWGGIKSLMGRAIVFFAIGLALQAFGQSSFSYYTTILRVDIPYPSIADAGYFGSMVFYILGIASLAQVAGVAIKLKEMGGKLIALIFPLSMLVFSYNMFLQGYEFDWSAPLRIFLDFGYPLGDAIYVSLAVLALILSRNILGGIMRLPLIFLMVALLAQYAADFNFLYQAANSTWVNGGYGDFMYLFSYFLMALSLTKIYRTIQEHRSAA